jgi:hypothetical protein
METDPVPDMLCLHTVQNIRHVVFEVMTTVNYEELYLPGYNAV